MLRGLWEARGLQDPLWDVSGGLHVGRPGQDHGHRQSGTQVWGAG